MPITIPLITDYDGRGVKKAERAFADLGKSTKALGSSLKSVFLPATAAVGALAAVGASAVKSAIEDQKAQALLAQQLKTTTKATDAQIAATESWISTTSLAVGVTDDELRPALASLVRVTKSTTKGQKLLKTALNVSKGTGKSLATVVQAISRAYGGNVKALAKLDPSLKSYITKTTTADQATAMLARNFQGAAATAANTLSGKMDRLKIAFSEIKEQIGFALLPIVEKFASFMTETLVPYAQKVADTFGKDGLSGVFKMVAGDAWNFAQNAKGLNGVLVDLGLTAAVVFGAFKAATIITSTVTAVKALITAVTSLGGIFTTLASTSFATIVSAIGLVIATVYLLIDALRDPTFRGTFLQPFIDTLKVIANAFLFLTNKIIDAVNLAIGAYNKIPFLPDAKKYTKADYFNIPDFSQASNGGFTNPRQFESSSVNITVNGGDPQATVDAITKWYRQNGATVPWMR